MKPGDKRLHNKGQPLTKKTLELRSRIIWLIDTMKSPLVKSADFCQDIDIRDIYTTDTAISNLVSRELRRLLTTGKLTRSSRAGWYIVPEYVKEEK